MCNGNWPLLPITAASSAIDVQNSSRVDVVFSSAQALILSIEKLPEPKYSIDTPIIRPTSPTRTVQNAFSAATLFAFSSHQWPMSMNEQRPMISQPRISWTVFSASTMASMPAENNVRAAKKCV